MPVNSTYEHRYFNTTQKKAQMQISFYIELQFIKKEKAGKSWITMYWSEELQVKVAI